MALRLRSRPAGNASTTHTISGRCSHVVPGARPASSHAAPAAAHASEY